MTSKTRSSVNRRTVVRSILATGAFGATSRLWTGCTPAQEQSQTSPTSEKDETLTIGFIYVGPKDDYGYNQAHFEARQALSELSWVKVVEEASVPETTAVQETMRNMIVEDGARLIFPTSWGYFDPHSLKLAREFPDVQFFHPNQPYKEGVHPKNVASYFSSLMEPAYIAGIVAGHTTKSGKLGFVVPKAIPIVLREVNSFTLGARSVKPDITIQAIFTGDWSLPVKEAEATNSLIDQGADVIISRVDNQKVVMTTAEKRGVYSCGYHVNQASVAPKGFLTGAEWNWEKFYTDYAEMMRAGKTLMNGGIPHVMAGGLKENVCKVSLYGPRVTAEAKEAAEATKVKLIDGSLALFKGEIKDNKGKVVIPDGKEYTLQAPELNEMDWLVEGVVGDTGTT